MSNSDSFIDEVSEELRRDRLFATMRRWGWLAALVVVGIVGTAAWFEFSRAQQEAEAAAFGDALVTALDLADPEARVAALDAIEPAGPRAAIVLALLAAGEVVGDGEGAAEAAARLRAAAEGAEVPRHYRDLAVLRAEMLAPSDPATARLVLGALAEPGAPFAALAEEQLALLDIREGALEAALDRLRALERSAAATAGLQQRASQLIVALEAGSQLVDTAPDAEPAEAGAEDGAEDGVEDGAEDGAEADAAPDAEAGEPAPAENN